MAENNLQEIRDRLNIVELIGEYLPLKKSGTNFKASCPFHAEKSASFMVSPQKQIWHCFGCGEGGDVFGFVMKHQNLEFKETLKILAQKAGVELERFAYNSRDESEKEKILRINAFAAKFFMKNLFSPLGSKALDYVSVKRKLSPQTIEKWQIGYSLDSFDSLSKALTSKKVLRPDALKAGVLAQSEKGNVFDRFRGRLMFPIRNFQGEVVAFTARQIVSSENSAKYINSPETLAYSKSKILFGLFEAKSSIRKADSAVIVEGQMDAISAHQVGFENTVATSGTALTNEQLNLLSRLTKNLIFCFDSDEAGQKALYRAVQLALPMNFNAKIVELVAAKDPDELISKSPGLWRKACSEALGAVDFYIQKLQSKFAYGSLEQKTELSEKILPLISLIRDPLVEDHYINLVSSKFGLNIDAVKKSLNLEARSGNLEKSSEDFVTGNSDVDSRSKTEKDLVGAMLALPSFRSIILTEGLNADEFETPIAQDLARKIIAGDVAEVKSHAFAKEATFMIELSLENLANNELALERELIKSFYIFKLAGIKKRLELAAIDLHKAEAERDNSAKEKFLQLHAELSAQRKTIEAKLNS